MAEESAETQNLADENTGTVMDSSTQGAQMLIRLKEGSSGAYNSVQGSELKRALLDQGTSQYPDDIAEENNDDRPEVIQIIDGHAVPSSNSVAVQANDYEIERRSGLVPARRRLIPYKFRDFQNPEDILEEDPEDEDYCPEEAVVAKKQQRPRKPGARPVGRPRKTRNDHAYDKGDDLKGADGQTRSSASAQDVALSQEEDVSKKKAPQGFPRRGRPPKDDPHTQPKIFKCLQCDKKFSLKGNLKVHMRTHSDERPFKCDAENCIKTFRSNESLRRHTLAHQGIKLFGCDFCQKRFASNVGLKEHIARHTDTKSQICQICQRAFRQVSCLRRHLLTHSKEQPHQCLVCGKRFSQMVYLRSHVRSHTGERPFKCKTCGKAFAHQSDVARHMNIHRGTKPFVCEICGARFSDPSTRRRHVREHNGFKPYTCQLCGDNFKRSGQLKAHLNKKHMNYKEDVVITKEGPLNSLQFQFKGNKNTGVAEQFQAEEAALNQPQYLQVSPENANQEVITLATEPGHEAIQVVDENGQIQQVQVQRVRQLEVGGQVVLGQLQQQLVQAGINQNQLDGNQIILAQTNSESREELLEETQRIIQQIQSQLEPTEGTGEEGGQQVKVAYHILHDDDNQQIVEIQYHPVGEGEEQVQDGVLTVIDEGQTNIQDIENQGGDEVSDVDNASQIEIQPVELAHGALHQLGESNDIADITQDNHQVQVIEQNSPEGNADQTEHQTVQVEELQATQQAHYVEYQEVDANDAHATITNHTPVVTTEQPSAAHSEKDLVVEQANYEIDAQHQVKGEQSPVSSMVENTEENPASNPQQTENTEADQTNEEPMQEGSGAEEETVLTFEMLERQQQAASVDYVSHPDFNCQEYYNWLSSFTELCKLVPVPLSVELFQKISQVHKTLSDVLATPRGILTNRDNFRTLMNISKELNGIINEHLAFVLQQLDTDIDME